MPTVEEKGRGWSENYWGENFKFGLSLHLVQLILVCIGVLALDEEDGCVA